MVVRRNRKGKEGIGQEQTERHLDIVSGYQRSVMDMVIFRTLFFELLVFFTFALLTLHFVC